ncbi:hypothetical protein B0H21DRAFT_863520 [Amylocystis lapponica]|nr:hypothetical protein B0H21DRAFT_863520 [Amylocystis lapponica]
MSALHMPPSVWETLVTHEAAVNTVTLLGFTALVYDHILTLGDEVNFIWNARMGLVSAIFLFNRYVVPLVLVVDVYETIGLSAKSTLFCAVWTALQSYITIVSFMSIHAIVAWRLYALHGGQPWIGRLLWISASVYLLSSTVIITVALIPIITKIKPEYHECVSAIPSFLWTAWLPSVVFETLLFSLTVFAMIRQDPRKSFSSLSILLYRDGMLYFVAVTLCSLFSLLVWALAGPTFLGLARYFALAMVNIAGSRLVLNLKGYTASQSAVFESSLPSSSTGISASALGLSDRPTEFTTQSETRQNGVDLELYSVERHYQHIGTRYLHSPVGIAM